MTGTVEFIQRIIYVEIPDEKGEMQVYAVPETVENVQELVRCKDCKHGDKSRMFQYYPEITWCNRYSTSHNDEWFCADGDRKSADEKLMDEMDADPLG